MPAPTFVFSEMPALSLGPSSWDKVPSPVFLWHTKPTLHAHINELCHLDFVCFYQPSTRRSRGYSLVFLMISRPEHGKRLNLRHNK
jgi:hypothetical protein